MKSVTLNFDDNTFKRINDALSAQTPPPPVIEGEPAPTPPTEAEQLDAIHAYCSDNLTRLVAGYEQRKREEAIPVPPPINVQ